jgi:predicted phage tail component-like protein
MMESLYFIYDNIKSTDMGVIKIKADSGLFEEPFVAPKTILSEKIRGRDKLYFYGVEREPLSFPIELWFEDGFTDEKVDETARWLDQDEYKPLIFSSNPEKIYYAILEGESSLVHNGIQQGYLKLNVVCNSPFAYSPVYIDMHNIDVDTGVDITFTNRGHLPCKPIIKILKIGDGNVSIINHTKGGETLAINNLLDNELVTIDCESEEIETDRLFTNRYNDHNDVFLSFIYGVNRLTVYGKCKLEFQYQFTLKR